jgi:hypothetical protein
VDAWQALRPDPHAGSQGKGGELDPDKEAKQQRAKAIMSGTMGMVIDETEGATNPPPASK